MVMKPAYREYLLHGQTVGARYTLSPPPQAHLGHMGQQLGQRPGSSLEFMDYRSYHAGDDLRHIDWNAFARSDRLTVKLYRQEICPHLDLVVDTSRSMDLQDTPKAHATLALAALVATAATNGGFSHTTWAAGQTCQRIEAGHQTPSVWDGIAFEDQDHSGLFQTSSAPPWRSGGMRILISDLLWPDDPQPILERLTHGSTSAAVIQVLARTDIEPPTQGHLRLVDSESGQVNDLWVDLTVQQQYCKRLERHQEAWQAACSQRCVTWVSLNADSLIHDWDLAPLIHHQLLNTKR